MKGWVLLIAAAAACRIGPPADREVRLARLAAEQRQLVEQLDDLQARLIVDRQRVRFWQEMRERHESISAIACTSQEAHAVAMAERLLPPDQARADGRRLRARVASMHANAPRPAPPRR